MVQDGKGGPEDTAAETVGRLVSMETSVRVPAVERSNIARGCNPRRRRCYFWNVMGKDTHTGTFLSLFRAGEKR